MTNVARIADTGAEAGRWTARVAGTLMVLFLLVFIIGEGPPPVWRLSPREQLHALALLLLYGGLAAAWFREGWGGLASLAGWVLVSFLAGGPPWSAMAYTLPAAIGALHVLCWCILHDRPAHAGAALGYVAGFVAIFVLLALNEISGMPPLMAPIGPPPASLVGTWHGTGGAVLTVAPDGSVSGQLGDRPVETARLIANRSWFGRLMHWRTDYLIQGSAAGEGPFLAPVMFRGSTLEGSLFYNRNGAPRRLVLTR